MPVITISGNIGSGALETGWLVAQELGLDYVNKEILVEAARALGVSEHVVASRDDSSPPPTLREKIASFFQDFLERSAVAGAADPLMATGGLETLMASTYREAAALPVSGPELTDARYKDVITTIMTDLAAKGDVVIIGRGSQAILRDRPDALHVATTAPFAVRVRRIAERDSLPEEKARERVEESDRGRVDFHHKYFKVNPDDPTLYDVVVNTQSITYEGAAQMVLAALRAKLPPADDRKGA